MNVHYNVFNTHDFCAKFICFFVLNSTSFKVVTNLLKNKYHRKAINWSEPTGWKRYVGVTTVPFRLSNNNNTHSSFSFNQCPYSTLATGAVRSMITLS